MIPGRFLIDSNVFITAKNFQYSFRYCRMFWDYLLALHMKGIAYSVASVRRELLAQEDELSDWVKHETPSSFFEDESGSLVAYGTLMNWAQRLDVSDKAKEDFACQKRADAFLIAHAMTHGFGIITHEKTVSGAKKRILIPNAAGAHGVATLTIYEFLTIYSGQNFTCLP